VSTRSDVWVDPKTDHGIRNGEQDSPKHPNAPSPDGPAVRVAKEANHPDDGHEIVENFRDIDFAQVEKEANDLHGRYRDGVHLPPNPR
jgi:hypothetical protein